MRASFVFAIFFFNLSPGSGQEAIRTAPAKADGAAGTPQTFWDAAFWKDQAGVDRKFGHVVTKLETVLLDGQSAIRARREYHLDLQQGRARIAREFTLTTWEAGDRLLQLEYRDSQLHKLLEAQPEGGYLITTTRANGTSRDRLAKSFHPLGLAAEMKLVTSLREVGQKFDYQYFDPTLNVVVDVSGEVRQRHKLDRGGRLEDGESLRIVSRGAKIQGFLPPEGTTWIDPQTGAVKGSLMEIPGIGYVTLVRTDRAYATSANGPLPDLGKLNTIRLASRIPNLNGLKEKTYRFTLQHPAKPGDLVVVGERQTVVSAKDDLHFELRVAARRSPSPGGAVKPVDPEYLAANAFIGSEDPQIVALARRAVANGPATPWEKAQALESWLKGHFQFLDGKNLQTASEIANDRRGLCGNCRHTAILLAALCRAEGIPSRTAVGLIYAESQGEAFFAFHMWTEVAVNGEWLGLDATLGQGSVGPGHIKVGDASWAGERGMTPLLPVMNFIDKHPRIELVE